MILAACREIIHDLALGSRRALPNDPSRLLPDHPFGALWRGPNSIAFRDRLAQLLEGRGRGRASAGGCAMDGNIFNSRGDHVGMVLGPSIFDLKGQRLYDLKGIKVYKLSGELVGHLPSDAGNSERRLDKSTDKLFR
jgi:hypothetical protein